MRHSVMFEFLKSQHPVIKVLVDSYSTDEFNNSIARHRVYGFNKNGEINLEIQCSNEMRQTGDFNEWSEFAPIALQIAGFSKYKFSHTEGSAQSGRLWIVYRP